METEELISRAKSHVTKMTPRDSSPLSAEDFSRIQVRETAMVCFEGDQRKDRVFVFLDQATGEFITIMYSGGGTGTQIRSRS